MSEPCAYCGRTDCHRCAAELHHQIRSILDDLERHMIEPDAKDIVGINNHLRAAWGARDAINDIFNATTGGRP